MHRSGTSALAGVLSLLGIQPGDSLMPAVEDINPKGFWEHAEIVSIHDRLLEDLNSSWDDESPLPDQWWHLPLATDYRSKIINILRRDFSDLPIWLIKDPRMCRLLPLWQEVFGELGCQPLYILALRNPAEVAHSLRKRDDIAEEASCLLWLTHMLEAEYQTRNFPRIFIHYEHLLSDWQSVMTDISRTFCITWPIPVSEASRDIETFLDTSLRHHVCNANLHDHPACSLAHVGFDLLSAPAPDPFEIDQLQTRAKELVNIVTPWSRKLHTCERTLYLTECQNINLVSENTEQKAEIKRVKSTVSWQITKPLRFIWNLFKKIL